MLTAYWYRYQLSHPLARAKSLDCTFRDLGGMIQRSLLLLPRYLHFDVTLQNRLQDELEKLFVSAPSPRAPMIDSVSWRISFFLPHVECK